MVNELKKHPLALLTLLLLITLKFIVVPIFSWQKKIINNIQHNEKKLNKIKSVLSSKNKSTNIAHVLSTEVEKGDALFFPYQQDSLFKLNQQQFLEKILTKNEIVLNNFGWQTTAILGDLKLKRFQVKISFSGKVKNIIQLFVFLESQKTRFEIKAFYLSPQGNNKQELGYANGGRITLNLYMHAQKESVQAQSVQNKRAQNKSTSS